VVAIIRLHIAWERSWVQYATTNKKKTMMSRSRASWQYTYIISDDRIVVISGEEQGSRGTTGGAEFLKSGGVVGWNVSFLATWPGNNNIHSLYTVINTQRGCHTLKLKFWTTTQIGSARGFRTEPGLTHSHDTLLAGRFWHC